MHSVHLILIGDELLSGKRQDRHLQFMSSVLARRGARVETCEIIRDVPGAVRDAVARHLAPGALIVTTGGLGPTQDDLTREGISEATGVALREDEELWEHLKSRFERAGRRISPSNRSQTLVPVEGGFLPNHHGTAPGLLFEPPAIENACVVALPGPPRELQPMFEEQAVPYLAEKYQWPEPPLSVQHRFCLIGESSIDEKMRPLLEPFPEINLSSLFRLGRVDVTLSLPRAYPEGREILSNLSHQLQQIFSRYLYLSRFEGDDPFPPQHELEEVLRDLLIARGETLAVAESCTGGWLAKSLTEYEDSSKIFLGGWVTYHNCLKEKELGVSPETLKKFGAVSEETAREMARGVRRQSGADWSLATTGIAGPGGGTPEKPVGLVFIALGSKEGVRVKRYEFPGNREMVRERTVVAALRLLWLAISGADPE